MDFSNGCTCKEKIKPWHASSFGLANYFPLRTVAMATVVSQHARHLGFFRNIILHKTVANFTEISRKHVFAASDRNIIKSRV